MTASYQSSWPSLLLHTTRVAGKLIEMLWKPKFVAHEVAAPSRNRLVKLVKHPVGMGVPMAPKLKNKAVNPRYSTKFLSQAPELRFIAATTNAAHAGGALKTTLYIGQNKDALH